MEMGTHKDRVTAALKELRKRGYLCRQSFTCCGGCGSYELAEMVTARGGDPDTAKVVWYHRQDAEAFHKPSGRLTRNLMLRWNGDAAEIKLVLEAQGLLVIHDGSSERCIEVACFDGFQLRVAQRVVRDLRARGWPLKGQNTDLDDATNTVAERLAASGVGDPSAPTARRVA